MEDLIKAAHASVPLSMTMREKIAYMRDWADTRARQASSAQPESIEEQTAAFIMARAMEEAKRRAADAVPAEAPPPAVKQMSPRRPAKKAAPANNNVA